MDLIKEEVILFVRVSMHAGQGACRCFGRQVGFWVLNQGIPAVAGNHLFKNYAVLRSTLLIEVPHNARYMIPSFSQWRLGSAPLIQSTRTNKSSSYPGV